MSNCKEHYTQVGDVALCWFEWGQPTPGEATLLLVHATGFHARCWDQVVRNLPGRHVIAVDMRGHGRSDNARPVTWALLSNDLVGFIEALDLRQLVAAGHSMGGYCVAHAAAQLPERFERLVLIDPVIMNPELYKAGISEQSQFVDEQGRHPVARRRNHFDDVEAMYANFVGRGSYGLWQDTVLLDYCTYGLVPDPEGEGLVLACPPGIEASIYMGTNVTSIYDELSRVTMPVTILRAQLREGPRTEMDFSLSPTYPDLASYFPDAEDIYLPELTHFIPMQAPGLVAEYLRD